MRKSRSDDPPAGWTTPESGMRWQLRLVGWIVLRAPDPVLDVLGSAIAAFFALSRSRPATRGSRLYLRRILGRAPGFREVHRHTATFTRTVMDRVKLLSRDASGFALDARGDEVIRALHAEGRGAVLLGAHYGSFEALRAYDRELPGLTVRYLMYADHAQASTSLLNALNPAVAARIISLSNGPGAMLAVAEALDRGEFVAFLGDRLPETGREPRPDAVVEVPFLGSAIRLPTSPYIASIAARAPLIFCVAARTGRRRYEIEFTRLHDGSPVPRRARRARVEALARDYAALLERHCRRDPYQWFNFFDIWRF